jgi:hypothetical protein
MMDVSALASLVKYVDLRDCQDDRDAFQESVLENPF